MMSQGQARSSSKIISIYNITTWSPIWRPTDSLIGRKGTATGQQHIYFSLICFQVSLKTEWTWPSQLLLIAGEPPLQTNTKWFFRITNKTLQQNFFKNQKRNHYCARCSTNTKTTDYYTTKQTMNVFHILEYHLFGTTTARNVCLCVEVRKNGNCKNGKIWNRIINSTIKHLQWVQ